MSETRIVTLYPSIDWLDNAEDPTSLELETWVTAKVTIIEDHEYGADADGNRGESRTWVDEVDIIRVQVTFPNRPPIDFPADYSTMRKYMPKEEYDDLISDFCEKVWEV